MSRRKEIQEATEFDGYWREIGKDPIPISNLTDDELVDSLGKLSVWESNHRSKILNSQKAILKLLAIKEALRQEAVNRGLNFVIPELILEDE